MRGRTFMLLVAGVMVAVALAITAVVLRTRATAGGPLQPPRYVWQKGTFTQPVHREWTFHEVLAHDYGSAPVVLDSVELVRPFGGLKLIGTMAVAVPASWRGYSRDPWPMGLPGERPVAGTTVAPGHQALILIGLRQDVSGRAGFNAVAVHYHVGSADYTWNAPYAVGVKT